MKNVDTNKVWTLESARKDYLDEPRCKKCEFVKNASEYTSDNHCTYRRDYIECRVKNKEVKNEDAVDCKYYTIK